MSHPVERSVQIPKRRRAPPGPNPLSSSLIVCVKLTDEGKPRKVIGREDGSAMYSPAIIDNARNSGNGNNGSTGAAPGRPETGRWAGLSDPKFPKTEIPFPVL